MPGDSDFEKFKILVKAIEPLLDRVVLIGGWAHRMYRLHPHAQAPKRPPIMTIDADLAIPERMPSSEADIGKRLHEAGFREQLMGDHTPPVSKYTLGEEHGGFYVEFLAPLTGSRYKRGRPDATVRVAGVTAQKLRLLDVLLLAPWSVKLDVSEAELQVANPASYIAQKLLIYDQRAAEDRAKDILYIHDTIELFAKALPEIRAEWADKIVPELHPSFLRNVGKQAGQLFEKVNDDLRSAAEIAKSVGRNLSTERLLEVCQVGLKEIFG